MTPIDARDAPLAPSPALQQPSACNWREDPFTYELVRELQSHAVVETRAFVKPIFKWMKTGVRKSGQKNEAAIEKAFAFVAWMQQLSRLGDEALEIPQQPQLDASYALNTIITSAQRASSSEEAERAFEMLKQFGHTPDVFAFTALIDVIARSRDVQSAFQRYEEMRTTSGTSRPNLVVFLTVIRAIGFSTEVPVALCLTLMEDARRDGVFDDSLYVRTIELCAKRRDGDVATQILQLMTARGVDWRGQQPILRALQRVLQRVDNGDAVLARWFELELVSQEDVESIKQATSMMMLLYASGSKALGCARHVSETARHAVMRHAIDRLVDRLANGARLSTSEFETLIHQCRKRKRKDDVVVILNAMREIATVGWTSLERTEGGGEDDEAGSEGLTVVVGPQPQLAPNSATYAAVVETFLACDDEGRAWQAFLETTTDLAFVRTQLLYRKYIRGCCLLMDSTHIVELLEFASRDSIPLTSRMKTDIAKLHGINASQGIDVIVQQLSSTMTSNETHSLLQTLAVSCASHQNTAGVEAAIQAIVDQGPQRTGETDMAVLECSLHCPSTEAAIALLRDFQGKGLLLDTPVYASLIREIFFKCMRGVTKPSSRVVETSNPQRPALKMLALRRAFIDKISELQNVIEAETSHKQDDTPTKELPHQSNSAAIEYWTTAHRAELSLTPMLFVQHVIEATATITDKLQREATTKTIQDSVRSTRDPLDFVLRAVCALPVMGLPFRTQGKLAKQLLSLVLDPTASPAKIQQHHVAHCLEKLNDLNVYVVKELDDALNLVEHPALDGLRRVMEFSITNLETPGSNSEKMVAFLVSRPSLRTAENISELLRVLANRFVTENDTVVLQYFKAKTSYASTEDCGHFVRLVIQIERETANNGDLPCSKRAIVELKLEHEAEFLPLLLHVYNASDNADTEARSTKASNVEYLKLPLSSKAVVIVDDADSLEFAYEVLVYEGAVTRVAFDAEWRPTSGRSSGEFTRCALLQLACDTHVFLVDLTVIDPDDLVDFLSSLLANEAILKLGFRLDGDLQRLRLSFPDSAEALDAITNVLDLATVQLTGTGGGLSALVETVLGSPLDKTQQCSDWERRPLSKDQIQYAALDAYCLLMVHDAIDNHRGTLQDE